MIAPNDGLLAELVIAGPPVTKKTSQRLIWTGRGHKRRPRIVPSDRSAAWENGVAADLRLRWGGMGRPPLEGLVAVCALFYRPTDTTGDLSNYLQALGDALERGGLLANDRQIASWDGSRRLVDPVRPRVEVLVTRFTP